MNLDVLITEYKKNSSTIFSFDEFKGDLLLFFELEKMLKKYNKSQEQMNFRLCINTCIILYNSFGNLHTTNILFSIVKEKEYPILSSLLKFLSRLPNDKIHLIDHDFLRKLQESIK